MDQPKPEKKLKVEPRSPSAQEKANTPEKTKKVTLPSGLVAECIAAKGKHVVKAQRLMDGNPDLMLTALISVCTRFEGKQLPMEEILEMDYLDYMVILGEFQGK